GRIDAGGDVGDAPLAAGRADRQRVRRAGNRAGAKRDRIGSRCGGASSNSDRPCSACVGSCAEGGALSAARHAELALRRAADATGTAAKPDGGRAETGRGCRLPDGGRLRAARLRVGAALERPGKQLYAWGLYSGERETRDWNLGEVASSIGGHDAERPALGV